MKNIKELVEEIQDYDFKLEYKRERNPLIKIKLQALHHLQSRKLLKEVADIALYDEQAVRRWIRHFIQFDYEGLIDKKGRGQKPRLSKVMMILLKNVPRLGVHFVMKMETSKNSAVGLGYLENYV